MVTIIGVQERISKKGNFGVIVLQGKAQFHSLSMMYLLKRSSVLSYQVILNELTVKSTNFWYRVPKRKSNSLTSFSIVQTLWSSKRLLGNMHYVVVGGCISGCDPFSFY